MKGIGLVFAGGGGKGAYQIGVKQRKGVPQDKDLRHALVMLRSAWFPGFRKDGAGGPEAYGKGGQ